MNAAQTLTERRATAVLDVTCPICGKHLRIAETVRLTRYPNGRTQASTHILRSHDCHPKETP